MLVVICDLQLTVIGIDLIEDRLYRSRTLHERDPNGGASAIDQRDSFYFRVAVIMYKRKYVSVSNVQRLKMKKSICILGGY